MKARAQVTEREREDTALAAEALAQAMERRAQTYVKMRDMLGSVLDAERARQRRAWSSGRKDPDGEDPVWAPKPRPH